MDAALAVAENAILQWECIVGRPEFVMHRENAVYKVETTSGFAALRIHRPGYHSRVEIESELQWMNYLAEAGVNVPTPFQSRQGSFVVDIGDGPQNVYVVDLLSWIDGEPMGKTGIPLVFSKDQLSDIFFTLGCSLAQMHSASDDWTLPPGFHRHALDREGLLGETAAWGKFWEASCLTSDERILMRAARDLAATKIDALVAAGGNYGLIHADLVRENILISNGKTQFIDFDDAGFGFRMYDFATALNRNRSEPHYELMKARLIEGYKSIRPLSFADENSIDLFLAVRDFSLLGWADARRDEATVGPRLTQIKRDTLLAARRFLNLN